VAVAVTAMLAGCAPSDERVVQGRYGPDEPIAVLNRTIGDGRYSIGYSLWIYVAPREQPVSVSCTVVDASGRVAFFADLARVAESGRWTKLTAEGTFDLPEVTLGIRCAPAQDSTLEVVLRDVRLDVVEF
jgi:hypothetical protein